MYSYFPIKIPVQTGSKFKSVHCLMSTACGPQDNKLHSNEKLMLQPSHSITKLHGWSNFLLSRDASCLYQTVMDLTMQPDLEKTNGVNEPSVLIATYTTFDT